MARLPVLVIGSLMAAACGGGGGPTSAAPQSVAPATTAPLTAGPTPVATASDSSPLASLPTGVAQGGTTWGASAGEFASEIGAQALFICPPNGSEYSIWGTDIYTSDSSVCTAGVHVGLLSFESGGQIVAEIAAGQESYVGSLRNGVTSRDYGTYSSSFVIVGAGLPVISPPATALSSTPPASNSLTGAAGELLTHVPAQMQGECQEVSSFDAGVLVEIQCINIPGMDGYVTYAQFDTDENQFASFQGNLDYFGEGTESGTDCAVGPSLVAHNRDGIVEGRLFCNHYDNLEPGALIAYWMDQDLLIEAGMVTYDTTFADMYNLYLTAGPIE
jgi:hypothetical protein